MRPNASLPLLLGFAALLLQSALPSYGQTLTFSGYEWKPRVAESEGPGPNHWLKENAFVDAKGQLHLKITRRNGIWSCAEVDMTKSLGFGTYQFQIVGRIDKFDKNVVLGLFNYPSPEIGPDGTNEIDIEFAHWGNPEFPIGNYTVWPARAGTKESSRTFRFTLNGNKTTQRFTWASKSILFQSLNGHYDDNRNEYQRWLFQPSDSAAQIPQQPLPVLINLWLFQGHAPSNAKEVEMIIASFKFTPAT